MRGGLIRHSVGKQTLIARLRLFMLFLRAVPLFSQQGSRGGGGGSWVPGMPCRLLGRADLDLPTAKRKVSSAPACLPVSLPGSIWQKRLSSPWPPCTESVQTGVGCGLSSGPLQTLQLVRGRTDCPV